MIHHPLITSSISGSGQPSGERNAASGQRDGEERSVLFRVIAVQDPRSVRCQANSSAQRETMTSIKEYNSAEHALQYLARADRIAHRTAGEAVVLELVPRTVRRILDLGAGDGRLLALLKIDRPDARGVATDLSPTMLDAARARLRR